MAKVKFKMEYLIKSSPTILYNFLVTPSGLAQWFAEGCDIMDHTEYVFDWDGVKESAFLVESEENEFVKYRWEHYEEDEFFMFEVEKSEVANDTVLYITDFAEEDEIADQEMFWDSQIKVLQQQLGA